MAEDRTTAASTDHPDGTLTSHFNIREKSTDDATAPSSGGAKVGDKSKMDHAKYPADPTKGDADHVDDGHAPSAGAADEEATKAPGSI